MKEQKETFTGYISKYALSTGIQEKEVETYDNIYARETGSVFGRFFGRIGRDCHKTREEAVAKAKSMRKAKIASLKKQIAKLESLTFA